VTNQPTRILLVEDNPGDARLIRELLRDADQAAILLEQADLLEDALARLPHGDIDLVLLDLSLPDCHGLQTFTRLHADASNVPIVVLTGLDDEAVALAAVKAGAQDYLVKGQVGTDLLTRSIRYAIERQHLLTELHDLLQREQEDAAQLRALDEMKSVFIAAAAHDLRTPLTVIQGFATLLDQQADTTPPEQSRARLREIIRAAERVNRLLSSLLDLERLSGGHSEPVRKLIMFPALVAQIIEGLDLDGHALETEVTAVNATLDPVLVERIVQNLLLNAATHTPTGTSIWLRISPTEGGVLIAVEDEGPGVPDETKTLIFEPFRRGPTTSSIRGSGVGLYLVSRFSELHGGRSWVEDRPGGGASFQVFLPATVA
jgi:sigma-B regulation protein RsbU (phosphoserine phosphatase)